ncbi:MAG: ATP-binding cassette domain-containing protein [Kiritimatiellae bacterium]|nr:ATP-binding cassette domain-containing protein [Kiritimatiellia bacterium]MBQ9344410.1 ATP-binding cassette domain-containing protein [Kiritimatiellia bacterium]
MIVFDHVTKRFGRKVVLDDVCLDIRKGETFIIVGRSGAGKSVTLQHMIRLLAPDSGRILVDGRDINAAGARELNDILRTYGVLFQSGALLQWLSVLDNVALPLRQTTNLPEDEILRLSREKLALVDLPDAAAKFPSDISGGMKKRAGLARAIVTNPRIVLYDEPTSGLDPVISRQIDLLIDRLRRTLSITSVVVTHDLYSALEIGSRIAMLHQGKIICCATPEEFVASPLPIVQDFLLAQGIHTLDDVHRAFARIRDISA